MGENDYIRYYQIQTGSGSTHPNFGTLYYSPKLIQQGRGFTNFFAAVYRYLKPLLISGFNTLKNTAYKTGTNILSEMGTNSLKNVLVKHGKNAVNELDQKFKKKFQSGEGFFKFTKKKKNIKGSKKTKSKHTTSTLRGVKSAKKPKKTKSKKNLKKRILDIFSSNNK